MGGFRLYFFSRTLFIIIRMFFPNPHHSPQLHVWTHFIGSTHLETASRHVTLYYVSLIEKNYTFVLGSPCTIFRIYNTTKSFLIHRKNLKGPSDENWKRSYHIVDKAIGIVPYNNESIIFFHQTTTYTYMLVLHVKTLIFPALIQ